MDEQQAERMNELITAVAALLADEREARVAREPGAKKTELLLADVGLGAATIAQVMGKNPDAIRKAISRARQREGVSGA